MPALQVWADLYCPYAYLALYRLRRELATRPDVVVEHKALSIEWVDRKITPRLSLDAEAPVLFREEPTIPYQPWSAPDWHWPVAMLPALEAVKCAELQGLAQAHELDWELRRAFWAESRCITMRHVILDVAQRVKGLDFARFEQDWDSGAAKARVVAEAREGWDVFQIEASPTFIRHDGTRVVNPGGPLVHVGEGGKVARVDPPAEDARAAMARLLA